MKRFIWCFLVCLMSVNFVSCQDQDEVVVLDQASNLSDDFDPFDTSFITISDLDKIKQPAPTLLQTLVIAYEGGKLAIIKTKDHVLEHKYKYLVGVLGVTAATGLIIYLKRNEIN